MQKRVGEIVVAGSAHVFMDGAGGFLLRNWQDLPVELVLQNRAQALVGEGLQFERPGAGRFQPFRRVGFG